MKLLSTIIQANTERLTNVGRTLSVYLDIGLSQQDFKSINDGLTLVHYVGATLNQYWWFNVLCMLGYLLVVKV